MAAITTKMMSNTSNDLLTMHIISKYWVACVVALSILSLPRASTQAQSASDSSARIYSVNYWVSGGIILAGGAAGILTIPARSKPNYTDAELQALNSNNVPSFDRWSLHQDPTLVPTYENYSTILQITMAALPATLLFDKSIRQDWGDVMIMGLEVNAVVIGIYASSPLGPLFQTRNRPITYYSNKLTYPNNPVDLNNGNNKNSFYSGHVASAAAAALFMAKVYCDYHPDANKYLVYGAAAIPPLVMGYVRIKALDHFPSDVAVGLTVGTLCGVLIPELHRIGGQDLSLGTYSSPTGTGLTLQWRPPVLASK